MRVGWKPRVEVGNDEQVQRESVLGQNQLKRRMPNGTYGVVGGRGLVTPSYPILYNIFIQKRYFI